MATLPPSCACAAELCVRYPFDWQCERLLWLANADTTKPFSLLSPDLLHLIASLLRVPLLPLRRDTTPEAAGKELRATVAAAPDGAVLWLRAGQRFELAQDYEWWRWSDAEVGALEIRGKRLTLAAQPGARPTLYSARPPLVNLPERQCVPAFDSSLLVVGEGAELHLQGLELQRQYRMDQFGTWYSEDGWFGEPIPGACVLASPQSAGVSLSDCRLLANGGDGVRTHSRSCQMWSCELRGCEVGCSIVANCKDWHHCTSLHASRLTANAIGVVVSVSEGAPAQVLLQDCDVLGGEVGLRVRPLAGGALGAALVDLSSCRLLDNQQAGLLAPTGAVKLTNCEVAEVVGAGAGGSQCGGWMRKLEI